MRVEAIYSYFFSILDQELDLKAYLQLMESIFVLNIEIKRKKYKFCSSIDCNLIRKCSLKSELIMVSTKSQVQTSGAFMVCV